MFIVSLNLQPHNTHTTKGNLPLGARIILGAKEEPQPHRWRKLGRLLILRQLAATLARPPTLLARTTHLVGHVGLRIRRAPQRRRAAARRQALHQLAALYEQC